MNRHFSMEDIQMAKKKKKKKKNPHNNMPNISYCKIRIKTIVKYHCILTKRTIIKNRTITTKFAKTMEKLKCSYIAGENMKWYNYLESSSSES